MFAFKRRRLQALTFEVCGQRVTIMVVGVGDRTAKLLANVPDGVKILQHEIAENFDADSIFDLVDSQSMP